MINAREASFDEKLLELSILEMVRNIRHANLLTGDFMTKQNLRVASLTGDVEHDREEHIVHLGISDTDVGDQLPRGLLIIRRLVDEEDSSGSEEAAEGLQRLEDVSERLLAIDLTVAVPVATGVDEGIAAADEHVELLVAEDAWKRAPLREDRLENDAVLGEVLPEELQHLRVAVRGREIISPIHQGDVKRSASAARIEDERGASDAVTSEDGFEIIEECRGSGEVSLHADVPELVERGDGRETIRGNGVHQNSPERAADGFGWSALGAKRDRNPASRHVLLFDPGVCPEVFPITTRKDARCLKFELQTLFCAFGSSDDRNPTGARNERCESAIPKLFKPSKKRNPFLSTFALYRNSPLEIPSVSSAKTRLRPEDASFPIANISDEVGVVETVRSEFRSERRRKDWIREEGVAVDVAETRGSRFDVLPVVHEEKELGVATGGTEMFHDLDSGTPGFCGERPHVVMLSDEVPRSLIFDVIDHAGDQLAGLAVVNEGEMPGHDGGWTGGAEETSHDGFDDAAGRMKEHGSLDGEDDALRS